MQTELTSSQQYSYLLLNLHFVWLFNAYLKSVNLSHDIQPCDAQELYLPVLLNDIWRSDSHTSKKMLDLETGYVPIITLHLFLKFAPLVFLFYVLLDFAKDSLATV